MAKCKQVRAAPLVVIAVLAAVAAAGGTAVAGAGPDVNSAGKAGKALKKAKRALKVAKKTSKQQGPQGPPGPGPAASGEITLDLGVIPTDRCTTSVVSAPGVRPTDKLFLTTPENMPLDLLSVARTSSATGFIGIQTCNNADVGINPPEVTWRYAAFR